MRAVPDAIEYRMRTRQRGVPATSIADLREHARRRLPRTIFDFIEGGSYAEVTLRANRADLDALKLRQRVMIDPSSRSLETVLAGQSAAMPVALAPTGLMGLIYPEGEIHAAKAAKSFNVPFCLSVLSFCPIEAVAKAVRSPFWFQLYLFKDRGVNEDLLRRASDAKCAALVLTVDLHMEGRRNRDLANGFTIPPRRSLRRTLRMMMKVSWLCGRLRSRHRTLGNVARYAPGGMDVVAASQWMARHLSVSFDHRDVEWVRRTWPGKLIIKGILDAEDARMAAELGADAIVVSNHGGRQLDGALSTVAAFPAIRDAVGGRTELLFDSGIRSGLDVLKALGLGAQGCLLGRTFLYGLGAYGEAGVRKALQFICEELDVGMALTGVTDVRSLPPGLLLGSGD